MSDLQSLAKAAGAVRAATLVAQELPGAIARFRQAIDP